MTAMTIDEAIETLDGIDRENTPPCEIKVFDDNGWELCSKPSTARARFRCTVCGRSRHMFMCQPHLDRRDSIECHRCDSVALEWTIV